MEDKVKNLIETYLKGLGYSIIKWENGREGFYIIAKTPLKHLAVIEPNKVWEEIYRRYMI